jgi:trimeric autotransporter adhesin
MKILSTLLIFLFTSAAYSQTVLQMPHPNTNVWAIAKNGNTVYIGGSFVNVDGTARGHLASFDCTTGLLSTWDPQIDNTVYALGIAGGKLIVAGGFTMAGGQARNGICMFDLATGNLDPWTPGNQGTWLGEAVGVNNNLFYYSGNTGTGSGYQRLYCHDATTGALAWQSNDSVVGDVQGIVCSGNYVWTGGGQLRRYDINTGAVDTWAPAFTSTGFITSLAVVNSNVYVGGSYTTIDGQSRNGLASFDASGAITPFTIQSSSSQIWSMYSYDGFLWVGGNSSSYGGQSRYRMAQFDVNTQQVTCWNPSSFSSGWSFVNSILVSGDTVYAGPGYPTNQNHYLTVSKASCIGTGVEENSITNRPLIFPNPSRDKFYMNSGAGLIYPLSISVYDITGRLIESHLNLAENEIFSFGEKIKVSGLYHAVVSDARGSWTIKLQKTD